MNVWARRIFFAASSAAGIGFVMSGVIMFIVDDSDAVQWAFTLLFLLGFMVAVPALVAVLVTAAKKSKDPAA